MLGTAAQPGREPPRGTGTRRGWRRARAGSVGSAGGWRGAGKRAGEREGFIGTSPGVGSALPGRCKWTRRELAALRTPLWRG